MYMNRFCYSKDGLINLSLLDAISKVDNTWTSVMAFNVKMPVASDDTQSTAWKTMRNASPAPTAG